MKHCHFVVVQRRLRNKQKSVMHVQSCCFANLSPLLFAILVAVAVVVAYSPTEWVYATDGTLGRDKHDRAITCSSTNINVFWSLKKDLFKGKGSLAKSYFKQNYCHVSPKRFAVRLPVPGKCSSKHREHANILRMYEAIKDSWDMTPSCCACSLSRRPQPSDQQQKVTPRVNLR